MNSSDSPSKIIKAFGVNGLKNTIPVDSSTTTDNNGVATFDKGFPPITMQPLSAGGIPPSGKDVNGVLYSVTIQQQWQNAGMGYLFDSTYASNISGYPQGATIPSSDYSGFWINTTNGNTNNPESATALPTGWVPGYAYGSSAVTISTANVNVSDLQAAKDRIILTGNLTGNRILYLPQWIKDWTIENKCTGTNFSVILSTRAAGTTVQSLPGSIQNIHCDGVNISPEVPSISGKARFSTPGTFSFTVPAGVTTLYLSGCGAGGGGGGGGGAPDSISKTSSSGGGGGAGISAYSLPVSVTPGMTYAVVIGAGGSKGNGGGAGGDGFNGGDGGDTSFGTLLTLPGGKGGIKGLAAIGTFPNPIGGDGGFPGGSAGTTGSINSIVPSVGGGGGSGPFGTGAGSSRGSTGQGSSSGSGVSAPSPSGFGAGGGGGAGTLGATNTAGNNGTPGTGGLMIVEW
ncbi:glycine-rich domain-containing protein [Enterobacter cloacae complex sp. CARB60]|uniref:glycine-rich domain-containing protein n=1 Tax=Enterobacter cloacae complex sp. CARB60 TaxID=3119569 RepID=UPI002F410949